MPIPRPHRLAAGCRAAAALALLGAGCVAHAEHPFARPTVPSTQLAIGRWNGVDLERRSHCANAVNEGSRGTYAQFDVATDEVGDFNVFQTGITGLNCTYLGHYAAVGGALAVQGTYSCTDGKQGTFATRGVDVTATVLTMRMDVQLTGSETCTIDKMLGMARFYP
jgi:hypothetical protein